MSQRFPIDGPLQALLEIFTSQLSDVRFGDCDATLLTAAAGRVTAQSAEVDAAESALASARGRLDEAQEDLRRTAQRALAYARVYAEDRPELASQLLDVSRALGGPGNGGADSSARQSRKRGRPPKAPNAHEIALPLGTSAPPREEALKLS